MAPASPGTPSWARYAAAIWAGVNPMDLSTPIRRYPATTAALATLAVISTASTSPMIPNATANGVFSPATAPIPLAEVSQEAQLTTAPAGSACLSWARSVLI
jgi:hypothetical protein